MVVKRTVRKTTTKPVGRGTTIREKANMIRYSTLFSLSELEAIASGVITTAYAKTFRSGDAEIPTALRNAAKARLKEVYATNNFSKEMIRSHLEGRWSPQKITAFLKGYRRPPQRRR